MSDRLSIDERQKVWELVGLAHTIKLRLDDLLCDIATESQAYEQVQVSAYAADNLLHSLATHLVD